MRYLLDTNILIEAFCGEEMAGFIREKINEVDVEFYVAWVSAAEFLVKADAKTKKTFLKVLDSKDLKIGEISGREALEVVAKLRASFKLKLPDSMILLTAKELGAILVTHDRELAKRGKKFYSKIIIP